MGDADTGNWRCAQEATAQYRADNDWTSHFLEECCEVGDNLKEKSGELFAAYRSFCGRTNDFCRSTTEYYTALEQRGFNRQRTNTTKYVLGLRLAEEQV